jgi:Tol biopolymer transport system component
VLGLLLGAVSFLGFGGRLGPAPEATPMVRSQIMLSDQAVFHLNPASPGPPVVSPDGSAVAFSAVDSTGQVMLYVRRLADAEARPLGGTLGAAYPFWSPSSQALGFFRDGNLCRIDIAGGPVVNICAADNGKGGSWNQDDVIIFAPSHISSIYRVAATGGPAEDITTVAADSMVRSHRFPHWLPDGRHFLYLAWHTGQRGLENETVLRLASLDGTVDRDLCPSQTSAQYAAGHLLYIHDNNLMGRPFSVADLEFTGPPRPVLGEVLALQAAHLAVFSATDAGVLAYAGGSGVYGQSRLHWHAGDGSALGELPQVFLSPQGLDLSPDGRRLAIAEADPRRGTFDIWVYEMGRDVGARFTFDNESELYPTWTSDGRYITYIMTASGQSQIVRKQASGAGQPEVLTRTVDSGAAPTDWSADDRKLLFTSIGNDGDTDIWLLDLDDPDSPRPIRSTPFNEGQASFSPDDRWIVYRSLESGIADVFVESLDAAGGRYRISAAGGHRPTWAPDASAIYYVDLTGRLQRTDVAIADGSLSIGQTTTITDGIEASLNRVYALDPAQDRILVQRPVAGQSSNRLELITGWEGLLGR